MLFNSAEFLFLFLPVSLAAYWYAARTPGPARIYVLAVASFVFWCWNDVSYLPLYVVSIVFNFAMALAVERAPAESGARGRRLAFGIGLDLLLLGFFKYANFLSEILGLGFHHAYQLPTGISFFTFTQIAYLVDCYLGRVKEHGFPRYVLFVSYFPHLIAGPIIHHAEIMPQFSKEQRASNIHWALGLTFLSLGLAKKMGADLVAQQTDVAMYFDMARTTVVSTKAAWGAALGYTMQIYLDFSAYCDMAIGISLMYGIRLPINFLSPYKAESIIDFWRRWHITLSRFLRDYVYIPLGGNRQGALRRYGNLFATMVIGGIWHGANWTFLVWGALHGLYLLVNHAWRELAPAALIESRNYGLRFVKWGLTFTSVVVAWVFFRADSLTAAGNMLRGMFNLAAVGPLSWMLLVKGLLLLVAFFMVMVVPNAYEVAARWRPGVWERLRPLQSRLIRWRPEPRWAVAVALLAVFGSLRADKILHFLYFNF